MSKENYLALRAKYLGKFQVGINTSSGLDRYEVMDRRGIVLCDSTDPDVAEFLADQLNGLFPK
jgi:hypothetical protein